MKRSWLISIKEWLMSFSAKPWACIETSGANANGEVHFSISANKAFLEQQQRLGMAGQTDEETLQLFFLQLGLAAQGITDDDIVNPEATPQLSSEANVFRRG
jgi:hypothetical protein